ncbi:hypothetical protein [Pseudomonas sp. IT-194MI4]|uniref:hypothetical protein n=1 Tax=Pseudomonas sp. IT-194MI4 TaxID=3026443 RepID=UPI0039DFAA6F
MPKYLTAVEAPITADNDKPIGVTEYKPLRNRPKSLERNLPSIAEIEAELVDELDTGSELQ